MCQDSTRSKPRRGARLGRRRHRRSSDPFENPLGVVRTSHGFFYGREKIDFRLGGQSTPGVVDYANVPGIVAVIVSRKLAILYELQEHYGAKDAYDLLEIIAVDNHNERVMRSQST